MNSFVIGFNLFIIINHIIMALVLWIRASNSLANILLGVLLFLPVFALGTNILIFTAFNPYLVFIFFLTPSLMMLFGPVLFMYLNLLMGYSEISKRQLLFHLAPSIALFVAGIYLLLTSFDKAEFIEEIRRGTSLIYNSYNLIVVLHVFSYLIFAWRKVRLYSDKTKDFFTSVEQVKVKWMKHFLLTFFILLTGCFLCYIISSAIYPSFLRYVETLIGPLLTACTYFFILFQGFSNQAVFHIEDYEELVKRNNQFNTFAKEERDFIQQVKYGHSALEESVMEALDKKLNELIQSQKPYLDKELTLSKLAEKMDISPNQLSQLINRKYNKKFFDFINECRIKEVEQLLLQKENAHLKIESIGELAGFNSRSTFFALFRKAKGITPAKFQLQGHLSDKQ